MIMTRHFQSITRILLATMAFAGLAFIAVGAAGSAGSAQAAGLRNCTEISGGFRGPAAGRTSGRAGPSTA